MNSQEVMEKMHRYLDGDLDERETARLLEHLRQSPESAVMFERLKQLHLDLAQLPKVTPPHSIVDAILPRLEALSPDGEHAAARTETPRRTRLFARWAGGMAAACAALLLVFVLRPGMGGDTDTAFETGQEMALMMRAESSVNGMSSMDDAASGAGSGAPAEAAPKSVSVTDVSDGGSQAGAGDGAEPAPAGGQSFSIALTSEAGEQPAGMGLMSTDQRGNAADREQPVLQEMREAAAEGGPEGWQVMVASVADGSQVIIMDEAGQPVYVSAGYPGDPDRFHWSEDGGILRFDIEMNGGLHRVSIDVRERTEETVPLMP